MEKKVQGEDPQPFPTPSQRASEDSYLRTSLSHAMRLYPAFRKQNPKTETSSSIKETGIPSLPPTGLEAGRLHSSRPPRNLGVFVQFLSSALNLLLRCTV